MPRGNDPEHARVFRKDTETQYGIYPNADEMIRHHRGSIDPALTRAGLLQQDDEATEKVREDLDAAAKKFGLADDDQILDAAVRGNALVVVYEDADGWTHKAVTGYNDKYRPPTLTPAEEAIQAEAKRDRLVRSETARLQADADARIAEARAEADARVSAEVAEIQAAAQEDVAKAQKAAAKPDAAKSTGKKPKE